MVDNNVTWRTAPKANVLSMVSPLFVALAPIIQNGVAPGLKLERALVACDEERMANFTAASATDWSNSMAEAIKMLCKDFRAVKTSSEARRRCFVGASHTEVANITKVLELLTHLPWDMNDRRRDAPHQQAGDAPQQQARDPPQQQQETPDATATRFRRARSNSSCMLAEVPSDIEKEDEYECLSD